MSSRSDRPAPGDARLGVHDDVPGLDRARLDQRHQRELRARRVAARICHQARPRHLPALDLRQPVNRAFLQFGRPVRMAVPLRIGLDIGQPEVRGEVHDLQMLRQGRHRLLRRTVRQAAEHDVMGAEIDILDAHQVRQAERGQMREHRAEGLACAPVGGERADFDMQVAGQQADQLRAGIAARAQDRRPGPVSDLGHGALTLPFGAGPRAGTALVSLVSRFRSLHDFDWDMRPLRLGG